MPTNLSNHSGLLALKLMLPASLLQTSARAASGFQSPNRLSESQNQEPAAIPIFALNALYARRSFWQYPAPSILSLSEARGTTMHKSNTRWTKVAPICAMAVIAAFSGCMTPYNQWGQRMHQQWDQSMEPWRDVGQETANALSPDGNGVSNQGRAIHDRFQQ